MSPVIVGVQSLEPEVNNRHIHAAAEAWSFLRGAAGFRTDRAFSSSTAAMGSQTDSWPTPACHHAAAARDGNAYRKAVRERDHISRICAGEGGVRVEAEHWLPPGMPLRTHYAHYSQHDNVLPWRDSSSSGHGRRGTGACERSREHNVTTRVEWDVVLERRIVMLASRASSPVSASAKRIGGGLPMVGRSKPEALEMALQGRKQTNSSHQAADSLIVLGAELFAGQIVWPSCPCHACWIFNPRCGLEWVPFSDPTSTPRCLPGGLRVARCRLPL